VHTEHNVDFEQVNEAYPEVWAKYKPEDD